MASPGSLWPVQPVWNAKDVSLAQGPGTVPNMADTIMNWFQLLTFDRVTKTVDATFTVTETTTPVQFQGVVVPFTPQQLRMKPEGQRLWKWSAIYALPSIPLQPDDVLVDQRGVGYRVMAKTDYTSYGYVLYECVDDYTGGSVP